VAAAESTSGATGAPWLSVLVPVYNVSAYVEACLHSIIEQADDGVEILALDDAGSDDSWAKVERIAHQHPRQLRLLRHERNRGLSAARNSLLAQARGRYVWFLDSDDILLPGAITGLRAVIAQDAPDLVLCDFAYLRERRSLKHRLRGERHVRSFAGSTGGACRDRGALIRGLLEAGELHAWSKIARREAWLHAPFPEGRYFEDIAVIAPLVIAAGSFAHIAAPWVGYRQHGASILASLTPQRIRDGLTSIMELQRGLSTPAHASSRSVQRAVEYFALRSFVSMLRRAEAGPLDQEPSLRDAFAHAHAVLFPQGTASILRDWRSRGWWLRARRSGRALARHGWQP